MEILLTTYISLFGFAVVWACGWFIVSLVIRRNDVADIAWGLGFVCSALLSLFLRDGTTQRALISLVLVGLWALRLSLHIYLRNRNKPEDYRYKAWRDSWGPWFYFRSFAQVYLLQTVFMLIVVSPVIWVQVFDGSELGIFDYLGVFVWCVGFIFETVADWQLMNFKANPENKKKIMKYGVWKYSRHPNYFGEVTQWWGLWIIALAVPYGWMSVVGPVFITALIVFVSGIPMLEKKYIGNPLYEEYKKRTSVLFPFPPKN